MVKSYNEYEIESKKGKGILNGMDAKIVELKRKEIATLDAQIQGFKVRIKALKDEIQVEKAMENKEAVGALVKQLVETDKLYVQTKNKWYSAHADITNYERGIEIFGNVNGASHGSNNAAD